MNRLVVVLAIAIGVLGPLSPALAQVTRSGTGWLLRVHYIKGESLQFKTVNTVQGMGGLGKPLAVSMPIVIRVLDTVRDKAKIRLTVGKATMGNSVLNTGQTAEIWINNRNEADTGSGQMLGAKMPEKPIKPGATWEAGAMIPGTTGAGPQAMLALYRFLGVFTRNGRRVAVIQYSLKGAAKGDGVMTLLVKDGTLLANVAHLILNMGRSGAAQPGGLKVSSVMTRK